MTLLRFSGIYTFGTNLSASYVDDNGFTYILNSKGKKTWTFSGPTLSREIRADTFEKAFEKAEVICLSWNNLKK